MNVTAGKIVILFDGVCNVCNAAVDFLLRHDRQNKFQFASLQSEVGKMLVKEHGIVQNLSPTDFLSTIVVIDDGKPFIFSAAIFKIGSYLGWPWRLVMFFRILPPRITD